MLPIQAIHHRGKYQLRRRLVIGIYLILCWLAQGGTNSLLADVPNYPQWSNLNGGPRFNPRLRSGHQSAVLPDLYWEWEPEPRWMSGVNWGGTTFFGSLDFGLNFFGSTLADTEYVEVELRFSTTVTTYCQTYRRDLGYAASGVGTFPGSAWDISDPAKPRRLNLCLVEDDTQKPANLTWDPEAGSLGGREYLFIMLSDYDGTGTSYDDTNWGPGADVLYGWWPRLETDRTAFETDPATLRIRLAHIYNFRALPDDGQITLSWALDQPGADSLKLYEGTIPSPDDLLATLPSGTRTFIHSGLTNDVMHYYRLEAISVNGEVLYRSVETRAHAQILVNNMGFLGNWNGRSTYGDVWGYTAPDGREYALLCVRNKGLSIIDITDDEPVEVGIAPSINPNSDAKDVKVYDHYAILIKENEPAQVIDLADPTNPLTVSTIHIGPQQNGGGAHNAFVQDNYLYTLGDHGTGGLTIYDLTDPTSPIIVGQFQQRYYHDIQVRDDIGYAAAIGGEGVDILDLSDKTQPVLINNFNYPGSGAHNCWTTEDGKYLFVGDEVGTAGNWTRVFDVSDPYNVAQVGAYIADSLAIVHNCYVKGNYLFVAYYTEGIRVVDISDPINPVEVAYYDTYPFQEYGYWGVWSVYPFFASRKLIASDMQTGLYVLSVDWESLGIVESIPPSRFFLAQNYPNPFNAQTTLRYDLPEPTKVELTIYDLLGREVKTLVDGLVPAGTQRVVWDGTNQFGRTVGSGVYLYLIQAGSITQTRKMLLLE